MPRPTARPVADRPQPPDDGSLSPTVKWVGGGLYAVLVLVGFCFGVWAGNQKAKPPETAQVNPPAPTETPAPKAPEKAEPEPKPPAPTPSPKATPTPPKKEPVAVVTPEPKTPAPKPPEPKKTAPEPKPEPKPPTAVARVSFEKNVLPVFRAKCLNCHGAIGSPKGGLDLRTLASIGKGGNSGDAVKAGDPANSPLWISIDEGTMPPPDKTQLTETEKAIIKNWILDGAK